MKLIIGGSFQGKTDYAKKNFGLTVKEIADGSSCTYEEIFQAKCMNHFHIFVKRFFEEKDLDSLAEEICEKNPDLIILSDEIGYGIVPMDLSERNWREKTGRICCSLAEKSDTVIRVMAGLPLKLKG